MNADAERPWAFDWDIDGVAMELGGTPFLLRVCRNLSRLFGLAEEQHRKEQFGTRFPEWLAATAGPETTHWPSKPRSSPCSSQSTHG